MDIATLEYSSIDSATSLPSQKSNDNNNNNSNGSHFVAAKQLNVEQQWAETKALYDANWPSHFRSTIWISQKCSVYLTIIRRTTTLTRIRMEHHRMYIFELIASLRFGIVSFTKLFTFYLFSFFARFAFFLLFYFALWNSQNQNEMELKSEIKRETNEKSEKKSEKISKSIQKKCHILQIDGTRFQFTPPLLLCLLLFFVCYVFSQFEASAICTRTRVYICINTRRVLGKNVFSFFFFFFSFSEAI